MVAAGGIFSLIKSLPLIVSTFRDALKGMQSANDGSGHRTERDLNMKFVLVGIGIIVLLIWLLPQVPVALPGAILIVVFGFFFGAVSSRIVGLVGSSNSPVSGMTIATLLFATFILKMTGDTGMHGMIGAIMIGGLIRWITDRFADEKDRESGAGGGILFCSGMIAGEGIVGILLAILAVLGLTDRMNLSSVVNGGTIGGLVLLVILTALVFGAAKKSKR